MFSGNIDNTADKLVEGVRVNKHSRGSPLIDLPDTYNSFSQGLAANMKQLVPRMEIQNCHQRLAIVAIGTKTRVLQHPVNFFAQQWDTPRTVGIELRGIQPKKAHLTNGLPRLIVAFDYYIV